MCYGSATKCTKCSSSTFLDVENLACVTTCSGFNVTISGLYYWRSNNIYIDPSSTSPIELGSKTYPYKTIDQAFIEIFNYWNSSNTVNVLVKESTTNKIYFQERPLIVNRNDNVRITTYTAGTGTAAKATLLVTNTETYATAWNTAYSLMQNIAYDFTGAGSTLTSTETTSIDAQWYAFIIIQCNFKMDMFIVNNSIKLQDDDFAILNPISNLASKTLTLNNWDFVMYGTVMIAFTSVSFSSTGVTIDTENLVGGFVFLVTCDPTSDVVTGEVVINNLTLDGLRSVLFKYGGVYMTGPQNFTIQNSYIGSYGFMFDAKQLTRADSPLNCQPTDNALQKITLQSNVYNMSAAYTGTPHHGFICSFLSWYPRQNMQVSFVNNTMINIQKTFYRILLLDVYYATVTVTDNKFLDSTGAVDISQINTIRTVQILRNLFQNISSTSQNIMVISSSLNAIVTDFFMNGTNSGAVSSAVLNLDLATGAVAKLTNIQFTNNLFLGTKAIVSQQLLNQLIITNSSFSGDQLLQNTNYFDIQQVTQLQITNTNFTNVTYENVDDSGAYLISVSKKMSIATGVDSYIKNVLFTNIKVNAFSFGGFSDSETNGIGNLILDTIVITNSTFNSPDSLISKFWTNMI